MTDPETAAAAPSPAEAAAISPLAEHAAARAQAVEQWHGWVRCSVCGGESQVANATVRPLAEVAEVRTVCGACKGGGWDKPSAAPIARSS